MIGCDFCQLSSPAGLAYVVKLRKAVSDFVAVLSSGNRCHFLVAKIILFAQFQFLLSLYHLIRCEIYIFSNKYHFLQFETGAPKLKPTNFGPPASNNYKNYIFFKDISQRFRWYNDTKHCIVEGFSHTFEQLRVSNTVTQYHSTNQRQIYYGHFLELQCIQKK